MYLQRRVFRDGIGIFFDGVFYFVSFGLYGDCDACYDGAHDRRRQYHLRRGHVRRDFDGAFGVGADLLRCAVSAHPALLVSLSRLLGVRRYGNRRDYADYQEGYRLYIRICRFVSFRGACVSGDYFKERGQSRH